MTTTESAFPVVIYGRVSLSRDERAASVDDQLADLRTWADREGWPVLGEFRDDGISASRFAKVKTRPGWSDAMDVVTSGQVKALLIWDFARASRDDEGTAVLKKACIVAKVKLGYGGQLRDPRTADGAFSIGLDGLMAAKYSAELSEKMQRAVTSRAASGKPHGSMPFGYKRVIDPETGKKITVKDEKTGREYDRIPHPENAPIVKEIVRRLLAREPADAIAKDLNSRGVPTSTGAQWRGGNLFTLARRPVYAGLRLFQGKVLEDVEVTWEALISVADHQRLNDMHADPNRDKFRNSTAVKHLLTGIARCGLGLCSGGMRVIANGSRPSVYACKECMKVSRRQSHVDEAIEKLAIGRLSKPDALSAFRSDDRAELEARDELIRLEGKLREARQSWEDDTLSLADYKDMAARIEPKIKAAKDRARPKHLPEAVAKMAGPDAEARWAKAPITDRRTVLDALMEITILPLGRGSRRNGRAPVEFDPSESLSVKWKC